MDIGSKIRVVCIGDSITEGHGTSSISKRYSSLIEEREGAICRNYGISGTRIARQKKPSENQRHDLYFCSRVQEMEKDTDIMVVFGGTNDYGHGDAAFGKLGDRSEYTFYGAFFNLVTYLMEKYGKDKICFILPIPRYQQSSPLGSLERQQMDKFAGWEIHTLGEYVDAEKEILLQLGINYLDLSATFPEPSTSEPSELFIDGLHPNDIGHALIAEAICEYVRSRKK